jgi:hypothetical protein
LLKIAEFKHEGKDINDSTIEKHIKNLRSQWPGR